MLKKLTEDVNLINEDIFNEVPKELYDECRNRFNNYNFDEEYPKWYIGAIGFLASYNGRFYDGGYAKTVISKTGKVRNYYQEAKNNLINQLPKLVGIKWYNGDYTISVFESQICHFIYSYVLLHNFDKSSKDANSQIIDIWNELIPVALLISFE